jgi:antirestriction protein
MTTPKIYVADLAAYNEGKLVGEWLELTDYTSGEEVMEAISELLEKFSKEQGVEREEFAIHDYEGFPSDFYSEYMGKEDFDKITTLIQKADESDLPYEVLMEYASVTGVDVEDLDDIPYNGRFDSEEAFAEDLVEQGVITDLSRYLEMYPTDMRILAQEEADNRVENMDDDDLLEQAGYKEDFDRIKEIEAEIEDLENKKSEVDEKIDELYDEEPAQTEEDIEKFDEKVEEFRDRIAEIEGEIEMLNDEKGNFEFDDEDDALEKAKEKLRDEYYDEIYDELSKDPVDYFVSNFGYEEKDLVNQSSFTVDYEALARDLSYDYTFVEHDGDIYVFSQYAKGGRVYAKGGLVTDLKDAFASDDLREELKSKMKEGDDIVAFAYTDYGGDFFDKVAIEYFEKNYPDNIVVERTAYSGKNAIVFGEPAKEFIEASENYILGYEDIESFYYEMQYEQETEDYERFLKDLETYEGYKVSENALDWLLENKSGYYTMTTQGLDFSSTDLEKELLEEGLIEKEEEEYQQGGGVGENFPPKGELKNKDNFLLKYEKKGSEYEFYVYKPEKKDVSSYEQIKYVCVNKDCPTRMSYNQFINYLYAETYLDDKTYANGGGVGDVSEVEAKKILMDLKNSGEIPIIRIGNHGQVFMALKNGHLKSYDNYKDAYAHYNKSKYANGGGVGDEEFAIAEKSIKMLNELHKEKNEEKKRALHSAMFQFNKENKIGQDNSGVIYVNGKKVAIAYLEENDRDKFIKGKYVEFKVKKFANGGGVGDLSKVVVYDNGGESFDRYTVFTPDGAVYGMSENAEGFNQYVGDSTEIKKGSHLGKKLKSVPEGIKKAVLARMEDDYEGGGYMAGGGEVRYKLKGNNFGQQIESGQKFKSLISKVFENQRGENKYPENFIKEIAYTGKIVKSDGSNYLKDYTYKGTLTKFEFLDDKDFLEALKYLDRPSIKSFKFEGGGYMDKGAKVPFKRKVKSISESLLERKKVPSKLQKDYGKTYSKKESIEAAKRIAGAMRAKEMAKKK